MDDHTRRVLGRLAVVAREVAQRESDPKVLLDVARATRAALDHAEPVWLDRIEGLALDLDAALYPWPPLPGPDQQRLAALRVIDPVLRDIDREVSE